MKLKICITNNLFVIYILNFEHHFALTMLEESLKVKRTRNK